MLKRSQSVSSQIPVSGDWSLTVNHPTLSPSTPEPFPSESFEDFQRVTISGDYCAGVNWTNCMYTMHSRSYSCFTSTSNKQNMAQRKREDLLMRELLFIKATSSSLLRINLLTKMVKLSMNYIKAFPLRRGQTSIINP